MPDDFESMLARAESGDAIAQFAAAEAYRTGNGETYSSASRSPRS